MSTSVLTCAKMAWTLAICFLLTCSLGNASPLSKQRTRFNEQAQLLRGNEQGLLNRHRSVRNCHQVQIEIAKRVEQTSRTAVCAATSTLTSSTDIIKSPRYPNNYPNNADCVWIITAATGQIITLNLVESTYFRLEESDNCVFDYLVVKDGRNANDLELGRFCGSNFPSAGVTSTSNELRVIFHSDSSLTESGFKIGMQFINKLEPIKCGGTLHDKSGDFFTPNYAESKDYPNDALCVWVIDSGVNKKVILKFDTFILEAHDSCTYDVVNVFDGKTKKDKKLGSFCGTKNPGVIESTDQYLTVEFVSDYSVTKRGFHAKYTVKEVSQGNSACTSSRPELLTDETGTIMSPMLKSTWKYPDYSFCQWRITVPVKKVIILHFDAFALEKSDLCKYDSVVIFDGEDVNSKTIKTLCGIKVPADLTSTGNTLLVQFTTDVSVQDVGFNITYSSKDDAQHMPGTCGVADIQPKSDRIIGGVKAIAGSWPWQVSLAINNAHICGGSIISNRWVITAAHCVKDQPSSNLVIVAGEHDRASIDGNEQTINVIEIIVHEQYNRVTFENDIALLKLDMDIEYTTVVKPVCLPSTDVPAGVDCYVTGWGLLQVGGSLSDVLNQVRMPIIDTMQCAKDDWYGSLLKPNMICAGFAEGGKDACTYDSGGPLVWRKDGVFNLQGITSWATGCAQARNPGVYVQVTKFVNWVDTKTSGAFQFPP